MERRGAIHAEQMSRRTHWEPVRNVEVLFRGVPSVAESFVGDVMGQMAARGLSPRWKEESRFVEAVAVPWK